MAIAQPSPAFEDELPTLKDVEEIGERLAGLRAGLEARPNPPTDVIEGLRQIEQQWAQKLEEFEDALALRAYLRTRDEESVPSTLVDRLLARESPIRVWREHRGLTLADVSQRTSLPLERLAELETNEDLGSVRELRQVALCLGADLDDLVRSEAT